MRLAAPATLALLALLALASPAAPQVESPAAALRAFLDGRDGPPAGTYGVHLRDAASGEEVFGVEAGTPRLPASTMKILTTGAALLRLGEDYRFRTCAVAGAGPGPDGRLPGDLVVVGGGDPTLVTDSLRALARSLRAKGVAKIQGDLVLDDARFRGPDRHPSWPSDQTYRSYCAPAGAFCLEENCVTVRVEPGEPGTPASVRLIPPCRAVGLRNEVVTTKSRKEHVITFEVLPGTSTIRCRGKVWEKSQGYEGEVSVVDPTAYFGDVLHRALVGAGISVGGEAVSRPGAAAALPGKVVLGTIETPLREAMTRANRESMNLCADCILKILGYEKGGDGSFSGGAKVAAGVAAELSLDPGEVVQVDGSGLSRKNRISPRALTALLSRIYRSGRDRALLFMETLATGGGEAGTLRRRLADLGADVRAKTGTINGVSALAGYVRAKSGRIACFAVLVNDRPGARVGLSKARRVQDEVCRIIHRGY